MRGDSERDGVDSGPYDEACSDILTQLTHSTSYSINILGEVDTLIKCIKDVCHAVVGEIMIDTKVVQKECCREV